MISAALHGAGLAYVAEPVVANHLEAGRLTGILEDYWPQSPGLFLYYPSRTQALPKLRAFVEFMRQTVIARGRNGWKAA